MDDIEDLDSAKIPLCFLFSLIGMFIVGFSGVNPALIFCVPIVTFFVIFVFHHVIVLIWAGVSERREKKKTRQIKAAQENERIKKMLADLYPETEVIIKRYISSMTLRVDSLEDVTNRALGEFSSHATKYAELKGLVS